jgi:YbbR domain-containing protein
MLSKAAQWARSNLSSFILALLLALVVWIVATQEQNPIVEIDFGIPIPIEVVGLQPGLVITNDYPHTTQVRLRTQRNTAGSISVDDILATADLSGLGPGIYQVPLRFQIATQAILVSANPAHIRVQIEEEYQREMPVQLVLRGQLPTGYRTGAYTIQPDSVVVRGPRSRVEMVSEVRAEVSLDGLRESFQGQLSLSVLDVEENSLEGLSLTPATVSVSIPISQEAGYRDIAVVARTIGRPAPGYYVTSITVTPPLITVRGDPQVISSMQPYAETQTIDLTGLTDDLITQVTLDLPSGVTPIEARSIEVLISIAAQLGSRSITASVEAINLSGGLSAAFSPATVELILSGPLPVLDALDPTQDVQVTVNLADLGAGTYQIRPEIRLSRSEISVESVLPMLVEVQITPSTP